MRNLKKDVWPFQMNISMSEIQTAKELLEPDEWCSRVVGRRFVDWYSYSLVDRSRVFAFKDEATLLVFKLAWGNYGITKNY